MTKDTVFDLIKQGKTLIEIFKGNRVAADEFVKTNSEFKIPTPPDNVKLGLELELAILCPRPIFVDNMRLMGLHNWNVGSDGSVRLFDSQNEHDRLIFAFYGSATTVEIKSPILKGKDLYLGVNALAKVLNFKDQNNNAIAQTNKSGGLHVHRDTSHWTQNHWILAGKILYNLQLDIFSICAGHRIQSSYCTPMNSASIGRGNYEAFRSSSSYPTLEFRLWSATRNPHLMVMYALITNQICTFVENNIDKVNDNDYINCLTLFDVLNDIIFINFVNNRRKFLTSKANYDHNAMVVGSNRPKPKFSGNKKRYKKKKKNGQSN